MKRDQVRFLIVPAFFLAVGLQTTALAQPVPRLTSRADLADLASWGDVSAKLVRGGSGVETSIETIPVKSVLYRRDLLMIPLGVLVDSRTGTGYVIRSGQSLYLLRNGELIGLFVDIERLRVSKAMLTMSTPGNLLEPILSRFVESVSDDRLAAIARESVFVPLRGGLPRDFFMTGPKGVRISQTLPPTIKSIDVSNDLIRVEAVSTKGYEATFWIDMLTLALQRTVVDGTEVFKDGVELQPRLRTP